MKKFIAFLLSMIMILSVMTVAFATDDTAGIIDEEGNSQEAAQPSEDDVIGTLYLCSDIDVFPIVGHCWIYVENESDAPIQVGLYEVPVGQGVSVGSFSFSVYDGWGIYYNLECWRENRAGTVQRARAVSTELTPEKLEKLTDSLLSYPNYWGFVANCSTFAFSIWNSVTGDFYFSLLIPAIAHLELMIGGGKKGELTMYMPTADQVLRQKGMGDNATLKPVGDATLR